MTEHGQPTSRSTARSSARTRPRRPALYRRALSLGVAAVVAAWLPFSVMYVSTVNKPMPPAAISVPHSGAGATRVVTTASGATRVVPANGPRSPTVVAAAAPVTTHAS